MDSNLDTDFPLEFIEYARCLRMKLITQSLVGLFCIGIHNKNPVDKITASYHKNEQNPSLI